MVNHLLQNKADVGDRFNNLFGFGFVVHEGAPLVLDGSLRNLKFNSEGEPSPFCEEMLNGLIGHFQLLGGFEERWNE